MALREVLSHFGENATARALTGWGMGGISKTPMQRAAELTLNQPTAANLGISRIYRR